MRLEASSKTAFLRYISSSNSDDPNFRLLLTACVLLEVYDELDPAPHIDHYESVLDFALVNDVLAKACPAEIACVLWTPLGRKLPSVVFCRWFDYVIDSTNDFRTLHIVAGAAIDFLRTNPDGLNVPSKLITVLLSAPCPNSHIVAAKLLQLSSRDLNAIFNVVTPMLKSSTDDEVLGALFVVGEALHQELTSPGSYADPETLLNVKDAISPLLKKRTSDELREMATQSLAAIADLQARLTRG